MAFFIFQNNLDDTESTLYRIAENQNDLDNLNIIKSSYKIIEDSENNFNEVKFGTKYPLKYNNNNITFIDSQGFNFKVKNELKDYIDCLKLSIKQFLDNNSNHPLFNQWNNYLNQLNNLNLDLITYPLNKSLEQYFNDLGQPSYSILQLP
jgi:hypothetical protein